MGSTPRIYSPRDAGVAFASSPPPALVTSTRLSRRRCFARARVAAVSSGARFASRFALRSIPDWPLVGFRLLRLDRLVLRPRGGHLLARQKRDAQDDVRASVPPVHQPHGLSISSLDAPGSSSVTFCRAFLYDSVCSPGARHPDLIIPTGEDEPTVGCVDEPRVRAHVKVLQPIVPQPTVNVRQLTAAKGWRTSSTRPL